MTYEEYKSLAEKAKVQNSIGSTDAGGGGVVKVVRDGAESLPWLHGKG